MISIKAFCSKTGPAHAHTINTTSVIMGKTYTTKPDNLSATVSFSIVSFSFRDLSFHGDGFAVYATREDFRNVPIAVVQNSLSVYSNKLNWIESLEIEIQDKVVYQIASAKPDDVMLSAKKLRKFLGLFQDGTLNHLRTNDGKTEAESILRGEPKPDSKLYTLNTQNYSDARVSIVFRKLTFNPISRSCFNSQHEAQLSLPEAIRMLKGYNPETQVLDIMSFKIEQDDKVEFEFDAKEKGDLRLSAEKVKALFELYSSYGPTLLPINIGGAYPVGKE